MKILVLSQYWYPENGVPQRRWSWLSGLLRSAGHEIVVLAPPPHYKRSVSLSDWVRERGFKTPTGAEVGPTGETIQRSGYFPSGRSLTRKIFSQGWNALSMIASLARRSGALRDFQPDLIIGTVPALPTAAVTLFASKIQKVPFVIDLRDAWPELFKESSNWNAGTGKPSLRERFLSRGPFQLLVYSTELMLDAVLRRAAGIITTSKGLERRVALDFGVPTATVRNVFPSPDLDLGSSSVSPAHQELRVLYAGTLGRAQKLENAVIAAHIAGLHGTNVSLRFVGDGATWESLAHRAQSLDVELILEHQKTPEQLAEDYTWADTALVHLTEWESLEVAVPSKTYELMFNGIHISGVAKGETAELIESLNAGDIVRPNSPEALARLWVALALNRAKLEVPPDGREWVLSQREGTFQALTALIEKVVAQ